MFGWLKNRAVTSGTADLDKCIEYLRTGSGATAIAKNTVLCLRRMKMEGLAPEYFADVYTRAKNECVREHGLTDHRNLLFCQTYIVMCFFLYLSQIQHESAQAGLQKILDYLVIHADASLNRVLAEGVAPYLEH